MGLYLWLNADECTGHPQADPADALDLYYKFGSTMCGKELVSLSCNNINKSFIPNSWAGYFSHFLLFCSIKGHLLS